MLLAYSKETEDAEKEESVGKFFVVCWSLSKSGKVSVMESASSQTTLPDNL